MNKPVKLLIFCYSFYRATLC